MDKNTIVGLILIFLIMIGFSYLSQPTEEQKREIRLRDSIARVESLRMQQAAEQEKAAFDAARHDKSISPALENIFSQDSLTEKEITLENNKIKLHINTRGGRITYVELKEYRTHDSLPLVLWRPEKSTFGLNFYARNKQINTEELLFTPGNITTASTGEQTLSLKLISEEGKYIEYLYTLSPDSYIVDFSIHTQNMNDVIPHSFLGCGHASTGKKQGL